MTTLGSLEVIALPATPPNLGGFIRPLDPGVLIGEGSAVSDPFDWLSGFAGFYSCALFGDELICLGFWGGFQSHLGFRILEDDGYHHGYISVDTPFRFPHGGFIESFAYETVAGRPIAAGAVPEPDALALLGGSFLALFGIFTRRRGGIAR